jgi:hypothetical protein
MTITTLTEKQFICRRRLVQSLISVPIFAGCEPKLPEPNREQSRQLTEEEHKWKYKFRGMKGGELYADAAPEKPNVMIVNEKGHLFYMKSVMGVRTNSKHSYGAEFGVPIMLRATWRDDEPVGQGQSRNNVVLNGDRYVGGVVLGDVTVPVAERIPDELLDKMRKYQCGFILKLRLTDETLLIGWELRLGRSYPFARDTHGNAYFRPEVDDTAGGDFCERRIEPLAIPPEGTLGRKFDLELPDWIRDKKTGQKVLTGY